MKKTIFFLNRLINILTDTASNLFHATQLIFRCSIIQISDESDIKLKRLTVERSVTSIPPWVFYHQKDNHNVLRFYFAKKDETLDKAAEKLCKI